MESESVLQTPTRGGRTIAMTGLNETSLNENEVNCICCSRRLSKRRKRILQTATDLPITCSSKICAEMLGAGQHQPIRVEWYDGTIDYYYNRQYWEQKHGITQHTLEEAVIETMKQDPPPVYINPAQEARDMEAKLLQHQPPQWLEDYIHQREISDQELLDYDKYLRPRLYDQTEGFNTH